jgi:hypothetical protein
MSITITHKYTIPNGKNHYTGLREHGYDQWELVLPSNAVEERSVCFRTSLSPQKRFGIAPYPCTTSSFEEMIRIYSNTNQTTHRINPNRMVIGRPVLSEDEIQQAVEIWTALSSLSS